MTSSPSSNSDPSSQSYDKLDERIRRWIWQSGWTELRDVQEEAIPAILPGDRDVIIAASTASGKTEAAFFPILTRLAERPDDPVLAMYVGPLKALINDQWGRLEGLCETLEIRVTPWHGDIASSRKTQFMRQPTGCLLITPESLEAMLMRQGSTVSGLLSGLCYVVIDELHSFMGSERGKQLQSLLSRLEQVVKRRICRVGLSATLGDMEGAREFLRPGHGTEVQVISAKRADQELKVLIRGVVQPVSKDAESDEDEEAALMAKSGIVKELYAVLRGSNNLIFPNTRSMVEFFADRLRKRCEEAKVPNEFWPHHGNLSKEIREQTEAALKQKEMPATAVCTSTLELGIDIGAVKSVAQIGAPPSVASLRQRLGRSGRRKGEASVLRGYCIERQLTPESSPSDQLRAGLVQSIAMVQLLAQGWYEPISVSGLHASTLVQQILSLLSQYGGARASKLWDLLCVKGPFGRFNQDLFSSLLRKLGEREIIFQDATGLLLLAPKGEKICAHYSFYAAFSSQEEFRVVAEGRTLGSMPVTRPLTPGGFVIFGGRRWEVISVSQQELVIEVKPGAAGALPSFEGVYAASIHTRVREQMRAVLVEKLPVPFIDQAGSRLLEEARENYERLSLSKTWIRQAGADVHLFLWCGDRINDTIALVLQSKGLLAMNHGIYVEVRQSERNEVEMALSEVAQRAHILPEELAATVQNKMREKWDELLPENVLNASFSRSHLDVDGAIANLRKLFPETTDPRGFVENISNEGPAVSQFSHETYQI